MSKISFKPLNEQVVVITGASSGIGLATARAFAKAGAKIVVSSRNGDAMEQLENELNQTTQAIGVVANVNKREDLEALSQAAIERFGGYDTWINNAGVSIYGKLEKVEADDMRQLFETNFWGVVNGSLIALEHLKTRGGALINLGSALSERAIPLQGIYCASKFAVRGFTDALRMEVEHDNYPVSVTLIKPAAIDTPYVLHAKNYLPHEPKNPPPVYAPEAVAETILHCAQHAERDVFIGGAGMMFGALEKVAPQFTDKFMEAAIFDQQQKPESAKPRGDAALYKPDGPKLQTRGGYEGKVIENSPYTKAKIHRKTAAIAALGIGALTLTLWKKR